MHAALSNILEHVPAGLPDEEFIELLAAPGLRIERIVSTGQCTPAGEWLQQDRGEWVLLLQGAASVRLETVPEARHLGPGDHLHIPAGLRHRVEATQAEPPTVWLAVHYGRDPAA